MGVTIEVFRDNSPQSDQLEAYVREHACPRCTILVYNDNRPEDQGVLQAKATEYGIEAWPAVALDGKVVTKEQIKGGKVSDIVRKLFHK